MSITQINRVRINEGLFDLTLDLEKGLISRIAPSTNASAGVNTSSVRDAEGLHYLPSTTDMHIHLDKHFLGEPWRPLQPFITLPGQLSFEKTMLASLPTTVAERARRLIQLLLSHGTTKIRTHVDVDPQIGISHLEHVLQVREEYRGVMEIEIVAFPQQGLLRSDSIKVMKDALRAGAEYVGGVDPAGLDRQVDRSLEATFELSAEFNAGVDLHLHDPGHLGLYTISRFADLTLQADKGGRTAVSHAYCLGQVSESESRELAQQLKSADVAIITSVPLDRAMPRVDQLIAEGVTVHVGSDNILDAWSPFGNGDLLARGAKLAEKFGWILDDALLQTYPLISENPLTPKEGDAASFILAAATNAKHAIASAPIREAAFSGGKLVGGKWSEQFSLISI
ncbi:cytosine/adenosine deaminase-related metal-dependent hydrolase [Paenibacillus endophyticus]|uniref:Cytosine/adenosine deaminase-related metal-dependent hydrolase n=1 Tax=Paenibacillus endophyticus TaxID=1294268 RepID=A0A7W5GAX0_9BACL|nr:amidohydrolase family protein [Paenibacillus endophyticus]MBB3152738.1 cytosine/adenosine deaminase-related metal-dependent hydrolase [Paenibacillus endophyticus]